MSFSAPVGQEGSAAAGVSLSSVFRDGDAMLQRPSVGDFVILTSSHEQHDPASVRGPLDDATAGVVLAVNEGQEAPFLVRSPGGRTLWRYREHALQVVGRPGDLLLPDIAYKGIVVERGPDW